MRNLKRALSLAVASVMLLGMMVVGSGASYVDVSSSDNVEAIEVMQAVGVMVGDDQGNFNPDQNVTRGEMAVIMTNLLDLGIGTYAGAALPFTDVPEWAHAYVAACYANGITGGTSATTYGTDEPVTAVQAGLMMMKALGYFQYQEDFNNGGWILSTVTQAAKIDLYDGIDVATEEPLTRSEVAQLALNALESDMVEFTGDRGMEITSTDGTTVYVGFVSKYDSVVRRGETASDNYAGNNDSSLGYQQLCEKLYGSDLKKSAGRSDAFGRPATKWEYKSRSIGTYADEPDVTYTVKVESGKIYDDLGLTDNIKKANVSEQVDGGAVSHGKPIAKDDDSDANKFGSKGALTEVYYDEDKDTVKVITINTYLAQVNGDYDEKDEELDLTDVEGTKAPTLTGKNAWTLSSDDFDGLSNFEDEDYVLITVADGTIKSIQAANVITATVTAYTKGKNVTADGTKYEYNAQYTNETAEPSFTLKEEYTLVLDANDYVIFSDAADGDDNYVYVAEFGYEGAVGKTLVADAYFPDGTNEVVDVHSDSGLSDASDAGWYSYSMKSGKYVLKNGVATAQVGAGETITENGKVKIDFSSFTFKGNAKTVFLLNDDGDVKVYTGIKNVPDVTVKAGKTADVSVLEDNGYVTYMYIDVTDCKVSGASTSSDDRIYILDAKFEESVDADDNTYYTYDAIVNGEETTVDTVDNDFVVGLYYDISYDENGYVDGKELAKDDTTDENFQKIGDYSADGKMIRHDDGVLSFGALNTDPKQVVLADEYTIYLVEADGDMSTVTASKLARDYQNAKSFKGVVYAVMDDDGYATEVYCQLTK